MVATIKLFSDDHQQQHEHGDWKYGVGGGDGRRGRKRKGKGREKGEKLFVSTRQKVDHDVVLGGSSIRSKDEDGQGKSSFSFTHGRADIFTACFPPFHPCPLGEVRVKSFAHASCDKSRRGKARAIWANKGKGVQGTGHYRRRRQFLGRYRCARQLLGRRRIWRGTARPLHFLFPHRVAADRLAQISGGRGISPGGGRVVWCFGGFGLHGAGLEQRRGRPSAMGAQGAVKSQGLGDERGQEPHLRLRGRLREEEEEDEVDGRRIPTGIDAFEEINDETGCPPIIAKRQLHLILYGILAAALVIFHAARLLQREGDGGGSWHVEGDDADGASGEKRGGWQQNKSWCESSSYQGMFCTPNNYAFHSDAGVLGGREHCRRLKDAGIGALRFQGDSMIRTMPMSPALPHNIRMICLAMYVRISTTKSKCLATTRRASVLSRLGCCFRARESTLTPKP